MEISIIMFYLILFYFFRVPRIHWYPRKYPNVMEIKCKFRLICFFFLNLNHKYKISTKFPLCSNGWLTRWTWSNLEIKFFSFIFENGLMAEVWFSSHIFYINPSHSVHGSSQLQKQQTNTYIQIHIHLST